MITITRRLEFDYGHRVLGHEGKCAYLHGHRASAEITIQAPELDNVGRVIDFGMVKTLVGSWVDGVWDHALLLNHADPLVNILREAGETRIYLMTAGGNPTAEVMAKELYTVAQGLLPASMTLVKVRIYETPNCWADYQP